METVTWVLLTAFAVALMWASQYTPKKIDPILWRIAGCSFIGAGMAGIDGWIGSLIQAVTGTVLEVTDDLGVALLGTGVVVILIAGAGAAWVVGMLPGKLFRWDPPDWLVVGGLLLPALLEPVPGKLGEGLRATTDAGGGLAVDLVTWLVV